MRRKGVLSSLPLLVNVEAELQPFCIYWECKVILFLSSAWTVRHGGRKSFGLISEIICSNYIHVTITLEVSKEHHLVDSRQMSCTEQQLPVVNSGVTGVFGLEQRTSPPGAWLLATYQDDAR